MDWSPHFPQLTAEFASDFTSSPDLYSKQGLNTLPHLIITQSNRTKNLVKSLTKYNLNYQISGSTSYHLSEYDFYEMQAILASCVIFQCLHQRYNQSESKKICADFSVKVRDTNILCLCIKIR